ncbi:hypothetical protein DD238_004934 [Peronospora effusa]|uniref:VHS domain-containing protein n=1 Tax=Peronospora effusa TaxID=542832 RepID=A0A3M6VHW3_9STRA|nr:hypothetical protein DD238_004934 [Peronospora effusa]RQM18351.1 hypothetical protein DD237_002914 [Peronospora effusa]
MYNQRLPKPESTYASQAARWKQGFKPTPSQQQPVHQHTDLENALVSDLCSSIGSSSFPPREVLQKLLRYLHTLDHDYICELLDDKFESPLWQVKAKALSVLSALLGSGDAEFYKQYYGGRLDLLNDLRSARKDMLRKRADKVYALLKDYVPLHVESPLEMMRRMQEDEAEEAAQATEVNTLMQTSPVLSSQQNPQNLMMNTNESPRSSSAPLPAVDETSGFNFLVPQVHYPQQEYAPAEMTAAPMTPVRNSSFGFLSASGGEVDSQSLPSAPPASDNSAFRFLVEAPSLNGDVPAAMAPPSMPAPSAPQLASLSSSFDFLNPASAATSVRGVECGIPTANIPSAFAQQQQLQQQQEETTSTVVSAHAAPTPVLQRCYTVFDTLPEPMLLRPGQTEKVEDKDDEPDMSDLIYDPFNGLDASDGAQALDSFDAYKMSSDAVHGDIGGDVSQSTQSEPLREVILEIDVPPGPMGVMLDRTIPDMTVIERFVPLPTGGRGYLELHPAICPGCALISINSIYVENKGLVEVGPILGSLSSAPKLLRFKKLMNNGRTANPSTLQMPYVPPPLEEEEGVVTDKKSVEGDHIHPEFEDTHKLGSSGGEGFMTRLNGYSRGLSEIEAKLKEIVRRERSGQSTVDRRDQLAQLHGNVEKIQTQGIDSVIFGERWPPNYEEVKQFRLALVRKADELARLIQSTASTDPPPYRSVAASDEEKHPVSAFAFVEENSNSTVNDPPLGISQLQGDLGFQFLNANANPQVAINDDGNAMVAPSAPTQAGNSYGFSFLRDNAQESPVVAAPAQLNASQAPTSPSSSFGVLSTDGANSAVEVATNVFAGLSLKNDNRHQPARPAAVLCDTLTKSSHGRPMGLSDLEASLRSAASGRPPMGVRPIGQAPAIAESTQSSFGFMSTIDANDGVVFNSSSTSTEPTSPTGFGFLRSSITSSTTPTMASSSISQSERSVLQEPEPSMFSFISN